MKKEKALVSVTDAQRITSLEIAAVTGKLHKVVLKAIREMEPAWENECGHKFVLTSERVNMPQGGVRLIPVFSLTKEETLYVATKFNDQARARLVLRWQQLEKEKIESSDSPERTGQKLLITEKEILQKSDAIRREQIEEENEPADGCLTIRQIAEMLGTTYKKLNKKLMEKQIVFWANGRYFLKPEFEGQGLTQDRFFHWFSLEGEKKERSYMVWTAVGMEFIRTII